MDETTGDLRSLITRGIVRAVHDAGQVRTVDVETHDGYLRAGIEVFEFFGHAGRPPVEGIDCLLLAIGGDPANIVALPLAAPARRFGNMAAGDAALYAADGTRVAAHQNGTLEILAGVAVVVRAAGVTIHGPVNVVANDVTIDGKPFLTHTHNTPSGMSDPPA